MMSVGPSTGEPAPDFTYETLDGQFKSLSAHSGKIVVLDFWATWCGTCRISFPLLQNVADWAEAEDIDVVFLGINSHEKFENHADRIIAIEKWWNDLGLRIPTVIDSDNSAANAMGLNSFPAMVIVGPDGKVIKSHMGFDPDLELHLKEILREHG